MNFIPVPDAHYDTYNSRMADNIQDKLFFLDRIEADVIVDYGCADGTLLSHIRAQRPHLPLIGYDISDVELAKATKQVPDGTFFKDWALLLSHLEAHYPGQRIVLVASSVIHEVYAYGGTEVGEAFWSHLNQGPFSTFVMRDMALSDKDYDVMDPVLGDRLRSGPAAGLAVDYEARWGSLNIRQHAAHFLLKYRYIDNWLHELNEHYLPLTVEQVASRLSDRFMFSLHSTEVLPFLQLRAQVELGVSFPCATHLKIIAHRIHP